MNRQSKAYAHEDQHTTQRSLPCSAKLHNPKYKHTYNKSLSDSESNITKNLIPKQSQTQKQNPLQELKQMKTQQTLLKKPRTFCVYAGQCDFRKSTSEKNTHYTCAWKGNCNQQTLSSQPQTPNIAHIN